MENESMLTCVSCDNTFEPAPHGGFCPECDTPHPDFGRPEAEDEDADDEPDEESVTDDADDEQIDDEHAADDEPEDAEVDDGAEEDLDEDDGFDVDDDVLDADDEVLDEDDAVEEDDDLDESEDLDGESEDLDDEDVSLEDETEDDEADAAECGSCGASVDPAASFCPDCGSELGADDEPEALSACPDCGTSVDDESFCPSCGKDLDAVRGQLGDAGGDAEGVTLVVGGESYTFGDGDTFGRQEEGWLEALVSASGGREEVKYISSDHLEFEVEDDGVYVTDRSTNGTSLNGVDLDGARAELEDGDELELAGRATVQVEL